MLWLCLRLPLLPLEVFTRGAPAPGPLAVVETHGTRRTVCLASHGAEAAGIRAGMDLAAAQALAPRLTVRSRDDTAEAQALATVASWAGQFTPAVSLTTSGALLEVAGSLGLFGGVEGLLATAEEGLGGLGYRADLSLAPCPLAAELLALAGRRSRVTRVDDLEGVLGPLALDTLPLPKSAREALRGVGLRTLADLLALPRSGLARRFGRELSDLLDRALGRVPDPRAPFVPPPRFESRLELPAETSGTEGLLFAAHRLLREFEGVLRARGSGALDFSLDLFHREREPTRVRVGLAAPGREAKRLLGLLRERLERTPLPAPATALRLSASELGPLSPRGRDLFEPMQEAALDGVQLLERLQARLGEEAVRGLALAADHRPERAFQWVAPAVAPVGRGSAQGVPPEPGCLRPLWLLPDPVALEEKRSPGGSGFGFSFLTGPERIETGWWDGADVARDYYVAVDAGGSRLWLFRERREGWRWFVHGVFG